MSFWLAAVTSLDRGMPFPSVRRWCFEPGFRRSVGLGPVFSPGPDRTERCRVDDAVFPIQKPGLVQAIQKSPADVLEDPGLLPISEPSPARHSGSAAEFLGQVLPGKTGLENKDDPGHARSVIDGFAARVSEAPLPGRDKGLHEFPEVVGEKFSIHRGPHGFPP